MDKEEPEIKVNAPAEKLYVIENPDKEGWHEQWHSERHLANIPHPFRAILYGKPNSGKGIIAQQLILHANPPFQRIIVWHVSPESSKEWNDIVLDPETDIVSDLPPLEFWDKDIKSLLVIDDIDLAHLDKTTKSRLDRTLGYVSTNCGLSVIITVQDLLQVKPNIRRLANVHILWKCSDVDTMATFARRLGVKRKWFTQIYKKIKGYHDFCVFDGSAKSPAPIRINLYSKVELPDDD